MAMERVTGTRNADPYMAGEYEMGQVLLDRYEIERLLGRGGMGVVYLVRDRETDTRVALKTIQPKYVANKKAVIRFKREAKTVRRVEHPAIVKFYDAGMLHDNMYFTMEYVKGQSIRRMLKERKRFGLGSTIRILYLLSDALVAAHQHSVHRDISPGNIMVTPENMIKLLDFGLAKLMRPEGRKHSTAYKTITQKGVLLGKRWYIAPEQKTDASTVDSRADIYSIGVVFHEMLTGSLPLGQQSIIEIRPDLPEECEIFLEKTLAESPDDRYASATEVGNALMNIYRRSGVSKEQ